MPQAALESIVQRMIDAGEPETAIASVVKAYKPAWEPGGPNSLSGAKLRGPEVLSDTPSSPSFTDKLNAAMQGAAHPTGLGDLAPLLLPGMGVEGAVARQGPGMLRTTRSATGRAVGATGRGMEATGAAMQPASVPLAVTDAVMRQRPLEAGAILAGPPVLRTTGRLLQRTGRAIEGAPPMAESVLTGAEQFHPPVPYEAAVPLERSGRQGTLSTPPAEMDAAAPMAESGPMLGPQPKPKLTAQEAAAYLRDEVGSEKAGRMLFGKGHGARGVPPAERQAAIKRLAPGESALPAKAARQMDEALASASPAEAYAYAQKAPNARAQDYFGERLTGPARDVAIRQMLMDMMKTR